MRRYSLVFFTFFHFFVNARISAGFCQDSLIVGANDSIFRDFHAPLVRTGCFQSKTLYMKLRKKVEKRKTPRKTQEKHKTNASKTQEKHSLFHTLLRNSGGPPGASNVRLLKQQQQQQQQQQQ